ncbi:MAG: sigma-70 family RNA polymerase sigma factor [Actinomycetota bacterium]
MRGVSSASRTERPADIDADAPSGDFDELYRTHRPALVEYASRRNAHDPELMADLALLDGYRAMNRMRSDHPRAMWAYLYRALNSHMIREGSKPKPELRADLELLDHDGGFEDDVAADIELDRALASLSEGQEQALRPRLVDDLSAAQIGAELGKSPDAIRQLQHQALRRLRRSLYAVVILAIMGAAAIAVVTGADDDRPIDSTPVTEAPTPENPEEQTGITVAPQPGPADGETVQVETPAPTAPTGGSTDSEATPAAPADAATQATAAGTIPATAAAELPEPDPVAADVPPTNPQTMTPVRLIAHDGFDLGMPNGAPLVTINGSESSSGFASDWEIEAGELLASFDAVGLSYTGPSGNRLQTSPGAVRVRSVSTWTNVVRPLAEPPTGSYWVSYLIRVEAEEIGDAFWFVGQGMGSAAFGVQTGREFRFVQGPLSPLVAVPGQTYLVVANVNPEQGSRLWVDPDLAEPGPPDVTIDEAPISDVDNSGFAIFNYDDAVYTIDEYRIGSAFVDVAPAAN